MLSVIKRARMEKGFTQQQMGKIVGIHRASICNIEQKRLVANVRQRQAMSELLGRSETEFFDPRTGLAL